MVEESNFKDWFFENFQKLPSFYPEKDSWNTEVLEKIKVLKTKVYAKEAGIGDTETDECIAYELDRLLGATPSMHEVLLNRK